MKKNQIIVIDSIDSPYFESAMLILKENAVCEDDKLLNEANAIVNRFAKKCGVNYSVSPEKHIRTGSVVTALCGIAFFVMCVAVAVLT